MAESPAAVHGGRGSGSGPVPEVAAARLPVSKSSVGVLVVVSPERINGLDDKVEE